MFSIYRLFLIVFNAYTGFKINKRKPKSTDQHFLSNISRKINTNIYVVNHFFLFKTRSYATGKMSLANSVNSKCLVIDNDIVVKLIDLAVLFSLSG